MSTRKFICIFGTSGWWFWFSALKPVDECVTDSYAIKNHSSTETDMIVEVSEGKEYRGHQKQYQKGKSYTIWIWECWSGNKSNS